ncbi:MAG: ABC transporter permease subunit, partial [Clostridia bacterium]|nr:ABC transporter permease subunit [Clostridia bacterium]
SSMGAFTAAFGMDKLNFGTLIGYFAIECGNVLGLGGAFFASLCAAGIISKEEKNGTADFLLTHSVSRSRILTEKLVSVLIRVAAMNVIIFIVSVGAIVAIGETVPFAEVILLHTAYFIMHIELAYICFGISAFIVKGGVGIGIGIAVLMYFLNLISNIAESVKFLKYASPFGYCDGAQIVADRSLDLPKIAIGIAVGAVFAACAFIKYRKKDIH